jgi:hypothetical protein
MKAQPHERHSENGTWSAVIRVANAVSAWHRHHRADPIVSNNGPSDNKPVVADIEASLSIDNVDAAWTGQNVRAEHDQENAKGDPRFCSRASTIRFWETRGAPRRIAYALADFGYGGRHLFSWVLRPSLANKSEKPQEREQSFYRRGQLAFEVLDAKYLSVSADAVQGNAVLTSSLVGRSPDARHGERSQWYFFATTLLQGSSRNRRCWYVKSSRRRR